MAARRNETYAALKEVFARHNYEARKWSGFKSCCASLMVRPAHLRHWPKAMYEDMLAYTLDTRNTYHASLAVSHFAWEMWAGRAVGPADLLTYYEVDLRMTKIRGCPAWPTFDGGAGTAGAAGLGRSAKARGGG